MRETSCVVPMRFVSEADRPYAHTVRVRQTHLQKGSRTWYENVFPHYVLNAQHWKIEVSLPLAGSNMWALKQRSCLLL